MQNKKRVEKLSSVNDPHKVKVLILTDQKTIYSDFYYINKFFNIVKLDLSYNKLSNFPIGFTFRSFPKMRTLFLHYNKFGSIKCVQIVSESFQLEYLTLFGNPLQQTKTRHYFVNQIATLKLMDDKIIRIEERNPELILNDEQQIIKMSFPIVTTIQSEGSSSFLSAVVSELKIIRQKYLKANPIIRIQRWVKKLLKRKKQKRMQNQKNILSQISAFDQPYTKIKQRYKPAQRLVTQRLSIHNSSEDKILSLLLMNIQFINLLRNKATNKVYALKAFCDKEAINYQQTGHKLVCLRVPETDEDADGKNHLQLLIKSCQKYLLRRIGSESSSNLRNKYKSLGMLKKKNQKQTKQGKRATNKNMYKNAQLSLKIKNLEDSYNDRFVLVKQPPEILLKLMKQHYYKSVHEKKNYPFCLQQIVERSAAALSIQRWWRGRQSRKKNCQPYQQLTRKYAACFIQKYIRNFKFKKRSGMFAQLIHYNKQQQGSNQLIVYASDILSLKNKREEIKNGKNFVLEDQKLKCNINEETNRVCWQDNQNFLFPEYFRTQIPIPVQTCNKNEGENILDLLFKGAKNVRYLSTGPSIQIKSTTKLQKQQSQIIKTERLQINKSTTTLGGSGVIVIKDNQKKMNILKQNKNTKNDSSSNYVIIQYEDCRECLFRKVILALLTYKIISNRYFKSIRVNIKQNSNALKNISKKVDDTYFIVKTNQNGKELPLPRNASTILQLRQKSNTIKLKFFIELQELSIKLQGYYPYTPKTDNKQISLTLPLKNLMKPSQSKAAQSLRSKRQLYELQHTANITRNVLNLFPVDLSSQNSETNFMSYREYESGRARKQKYRYEEIQNSIINRRSLQKSQSMQSPKNKQQSSTAYFMIMDRNLEKSYATQINTEGYGEGQNTGRTNGIEKSIRYSSIQDDKQEKKKKIGQLKESHKQRIQENIRYKKQELSKLRIKINDEHQANNKILETHRQEGTIQNARRHEMVKKALSHKLTQIQRFERDFLKRGNSSIRKDLMKFQQQRSSKSPDNQSVYDSLKSLETEVFKNHLRNKSKHIFNLKTQIKEFSIDGSDGDADMSLGAIQVQNKSKGIYRKPWQQKVEAKQQNEQMKKKAKSSKKQIKKRKVVHSVFPQQFYPLKQSKRIGFELPKIGKK